MFFYMYTATGDFQRIDAGTDRDTIEHFESTSTAPPPIPAGLPLFRIGESESKIEKRLELAGEIDASVKTFDTIYGSTMNAIKGAEAQSQDNKATFSGLVREAEKSKGTDPEGYKKDMEMINKTIETTKSEFVAFYRKNTENIDKCRMAIVRIEQLLAEAGDFLDVFGKFCTEVAPTMNLKQKGEPIFIDVTSYKTPRMPMEGVPPKGPCDKWQEPLAKIQNARAAKDSMKARLAELQANYQRVLPIVERSFDV